MKPVKAWEALKAWQEEGRKCWPTDLGKGQHCVYEPPWHWAGFWEREFELEPPKPQVVEFETSWGKVKCHDESFVVFPNFMSDEIFKKLQRKRWRVTCTEIVE